MLLVTKNFQDGEFTSNITDVHTCRRDRSYFTAVLLQLELCNVAVTLQIIIYWILQHL